MNTQLDLNVPAIIQRKLSEKEIRQEVLEECAKFLENLKQQRLPEVLRNCDLGDDSEGWVDFSLTDKHLLNSIAQRIREDKQSA
jgi:hypothetical protein